MTLHLNVSYNVRITFLCYCRVRLSSIHNRDRLSFDYLPGSTRRQRGLSIRTRPAFNALTGC